MCLASVTHEDRNLSRVLTPPPPIATYCLPVISLSVAGHYIKHLASCLAYRVGRYIYKHIKLRGYTV
ncbi:hypothetical protein L1887_27344 [Cichorium endivia]|nr:hypothetical protein L1887_27344 [Cichorium endivia]